MTISNQPNAVELQVAMNTASRKNLYVIAKWFNFASFIWAAIIFIVFIGMAIGTSASLDVTLREAQAVKATYIGVAIIMLINSLVSLWFWLYMKKIVPTVGTVQEVPHVGFGVCDLIFANLISGILILVASHSFKQAQVLHQFNTKSVSQA